ncbi:MAG: L,D-transpeptidase family protein [Burkholderiaceae bacterium]
MPTRARISGRRPVLRLALTASLFALACLRAGAAGAVDQPPAIVHPNDRALIPDLVQTFYADRTHALVWADDRRFDLLLDAIAGLLEHGLDPENYHLSSLRRLRGNPIARDRLATDAWLSAAAHLLLGKVDPLRIEPDWTAHSRHADLSAGLDAALRSGDIANALFAYAPKHPEYRALRLELRRLQLSPDAVATPSAASRLAADGPAPSRTERMARLRANLERWRWLPDDLGTRHVRVNIAGFRVERFEHGRSVATHRAIVGRTYRKTPVFSSLIRYVVLNPWWETPASIAARDELPMFRRDPGAVQRLGFQVLDARGNALDPAGIDWRNVSADPFPFRLRQAPGPLNALGRAKVMFPNVHNVYLHDTPARELFEQQQRTFSSGCVRTQNVLALIEWLFQDSSTWTPAQLRSTVDSGRETHIALPSPVPVHILYLTAERDGDRIRYLGDVYDRDAGLLKALERDPHDR